MAVWIYKFNFNLKNSKNIVYILYIYGEITKLFIDSVHVGESFWFVLCRENLTL